ncbi:curli production assembly/transport protein CsgE [Microbulbifer sp. OS29]|uniref:Curli production assembly/transport component CsgE n=1 Tax=Microbulbifer okhotskensis TaxID=2926617 RepID=A0A9X2ETP9_9GAMM|nr:curli production assembly/transport protein CsgE [Microbulbifer okhotskensis]MCO1335616.1 curli production assembly/transport protein CsgE [Microbulbifer okhotskensis]
MRPALLMLALCTSLAFGQDDTTVPPADTDSGRLEDEISGFNIDRTITRTGHDFVRYMSEYRNLNYPDASYNLTIYERPSARWGNLIWVTYNDKIVFRRFISPSTNNTHRLADEAAQYIHQEVLQQRVRNSITDNFDLGKDEF